MATFNPGNLASYRIFNGFAPREKPKSLYIPLDFSVDKQIDVNLFDDNSRGKLSFVQAIFVDNYDNQFPLTILVGISQQRLVVPATSQGTFPIFAPDQATFSFRTAPANPLIVGAHLLNVPVPFAIWG